MNVRKYLFEFEDLGWFPNKIRESMTDYLRYVLTLINFYKPITPLLIDGLKKTNSTQIIDLCSGGGGAMEQILFNLKQQSFSEIKIILTDKYPNTSAYTYLHTKTSGNISFSHLPVDATHVTPNLKGFKTLFSSFHHFNIDVAKAVLKNAVDSKSGVGIFDGGNKNFFFIIGITLMHPIAFFLLTPFFKPFRFSRIIFTYFIPVIPLCTIWDGIVSIIRLYKPAELLKMAQDIDNEHYTWKAGRIKNKLGMHVTFLIGYPIL